MIKKIVLFLFFILVIAVGIGVLYLYLMPPKETVEVRKAEINNIETMAQLCAVEIYSEVPVLDTINNKVMFAIQKQKGSISFDLENLEMDNSGDTVKIILSPEIVDLYEATEDNSWEVIDTKAIGPLALIRSDKFTNAEENIIKARIKTNSKKLLYRNGTIERARKEGAANLKMLMEQLYRKPVVITDPTPKGAHYNAYK